MKTQKNKLNVDEFIRNIPDGKRRKDAAVVLEIYREATGQKPVMWGDSTIGFGEYTYRRSDGQEYSFFAAGFSPRKHYLSLYVLSGFDEYAAASGLDLQPLLRKLGPHKTAKSCLYIKDVELVDKRVLEQLIRESYEHMQKL